MSLPAEAINMELCHEMEAHIEKLTTSGQMTLDVDIVKKIKKICRQSDTYVTRAFHQLMVLLEKEHAEIRLSALQIVDELFNRSHCFRELLLSDFQNFMDLTLEIDHDYPLPPPKPVAKILKVKAIEAIQLWQDKFGSTYKKLTLGYNFLKDCKKVDFADLRARSIAERRQSEENRQRQDVLRQQKVNTAVQEMAEMTCEIKDSMTQAENCLQLLLPRPETFQLHGLKSPVHSSQYGGHPLALTTEVSDPSHSGSKGGKSTSPHGGDSSSGNVDSSGTTASVTTVVKQEPGLSSVLDSKGGSTGTAGPGIIKSEIPVKSDGPLPTVNCHSEMEAGPSRSSTNEGNSSGSLVKSPVEKMDSSRTEAPTEISMNEDAEDEDRDGDSSEEFEELSDETSEDEGDLMTSDDLRGHGLGSQKYTLSLDLPPDGVHLKETPDNTDILYVLKDVVQLVSNKFLPSLQKWMEIFAKAGNQELNIRKAIDLKRLVLEMKIKICQLKVARMKKNPEQTKTDGAAATGEEEEEDDFEEVPQKEGFEPRIPDHLREEYGLVPKPPKPQTSRDWTMPAPSKVQDHKLDNLEEQDPTTWSATLKNMEAELSSSQGNEVTSSKAGSTGKVKGQSKRKNELLQKAPMRPYGTDLFHWGEKLETPFLVRFDSEHRFWTPKDNETVVDVNALESMKSRLINFVGDFKPVKWKCRAPLANGALCERMDRVKCPFHGKIIPRNQLGQPANAEDLRELERQMEKKQQESVPEWEDPQLQADIKAATGIDLSWKGKGRGRGKGKGQRKNKFPNLTDIKKVKNTSRNRLESKVLSPKTMKRVAAAMNQIEHKKFKDKFGNTFINTFNPR